MSSTPLPATGRRAAALPPEERRAAIIAATEPLLAEIGQQVTTRQIAEAAGIAEGTIFRVFADKDELLAATYGAVLDRRSVDEAIAAIDTDLPLREQLMAATEAVRERLQYLWRLHANLSPHLRSTNPRPLQVSEALVALLAAESDAFRVPPEEAARMVHAFTVATTHPLLVTEPRPPDEIVTLLLEGIGAR